MKAIKSSLLAIAVLTGVSAAHAATIETFSVSETGSSTAGSTQSLTGSAVLDDSGTLTVSLTGTFNAGIYGIANITKTNVFSGTLSGNSYTPTGGTTAINTCTNAPTLCGFVTLNAPAALTSWGGILDLVAGGSLTGAISATSNGTTTTASATDVFTPTSTPAVPVPAAAWLFGSGLLGLAGVSRRRS